MHIFFNVLNKIFVAASECVDTFVITITVLLCEHQTCVNCARVNQFAIINRKT